MVLVPGDPPMIWEARHVPHGAVTTHYYLSRTVGIERSFSVYTPPAYGKDPQARYPVLYLLHGSGDHARTWVEVGQANFILDNLIAANRAKPMIVVMPFGQMSNVSMVPDRGHPLFEGDLLHDILPVVERHYRALTDRDHRAIAGLSMGGGQSMTVGLGHPELFGWVGVFSASAPAEDFSQRFAGLLADPDETNRKLHLLWIGIGN